MELWTPTIAEPWSQRIKAFFDGLPQDTQWLILGLGVLFLLSWLYLLLSVRSMKRKTAQVAREVHEAIDRMSGPAMEQQAELIRRVGWAVSYLERIDQTLESPQRFTSASRSA